MDDKKISLLSAKPGKLDALVEAVPDLFGKIKGLRDSLKKDSGGKDTVEGKSEESSGSDEGGNPGQVGGW